MSDSICPICKSDEYEKKVGFPLRVDFVCNDCTDKIGILYEFNVDSTALISDEIIEGFMLGIRASGALDYGGYATLDQVFKGKTENR